MWDRKRKTSLTQKSFFNKKWNLHYIIDLMNNTTETMWPLMLATQESLHVTYGATIMLHEKVRLEYDYSIIKNL